VGKEAQRLDKRAVEKRRRAVFNYESHSFAQGHRSQHIHRSSEEKIHDSHYFVKYLQINIFLGPLVNMASEAFSLSTE